AAKSSLCSTSRLRCTCSLAPSSSGCSMRSGVRSTLISGSIITIYAAPAARYRRGVEEFERHMMYDVVIVGYGPTGMLSAILLGRAGHRVAVIERHTTLYNLPRVGIVHDDVLRMFQEVGCLETIW